jgi:hypothetical protein
MQIDTVNNSAVIKTFIKESKGLTRAGFNPQTRQIL